LISLIKVAITAGGHKIRSLKRTTLALRDNMIDCDVFGLAPAIEAATIK
jgi:hypothetical protein